MNLYAALLHAFSILSLSVSTLANNADSDCTPTQSNERINLRDMVLDGLNKCFVKVGNFDLQTLMGNESPSVTNSVIEEFCQKQDLIRNCLSAHSSACLDEKEHNDNKYVEDILKTALSYSCAGGGKYLMTVTFHLCLGESSTLERNGFTECIATAKATGVEGNALDSSTRLLGLYREFKVFKQCLLDRLRGPNGDVFNAQLILNGILRSIRCHHSEDGTTVPCESLDAVTPTEEKICPFVGYEHDAPPTFIIFSNYIAECVMVNFNRQDLKKITTFTNIDDFRSLFNTYCQNISPMLNCLGDISANSKVCQNETDHQLLELFKYILEYSIESGCKEDGASLATMGNAFLNRADSVMRNDTVKNCIRAAEDVYKRVSSINDTPSTFTVLMYRSVEPLKQCILDGSSDVGTFKTVFATFMNDILRHAKCLADDGTVVLCSTLVN